MLHFRSTVALKELFHTQLKAGRVGVKAAPAPAAFAAAAAACLSTACSDGRGFAGWRAPQQRFSRRQGGVRDFCAKGDGHNEASKDSSAEK